MKKSFRNTYWFAVSIFKRYITIIVSSLVIGIIVTLNADKIFSLLPKSNTIYIGRVGAYTLAQLPLDIQRLVSSGLTKIDSTGKVTPDLAISWNIQESGKLYQFTLDQNATWQDGTPVVSKDIDINLSDVELQKSTSSISFRLKDPFSPFPSIVSQPLFKKSNYKKFLFFNRTKIIGTNDFSIIKVKTKSNVITQLTLKSSDQKRIYRFYPTEEDAIIAYKLGKVDMLEEIANPKDLKNWKNTTVTQQEYTDKYVAIFLNTQDPTLTNKTIRQALAYAIPKQKFEEKRAINPINPKSWAHNPQVKSYDHDAALSQEYIKKAAGGEDQAPITLTLTTTQAFIDQAEVIVQAWKEVGIDTSLQIVNYPDTNNYQALLIGQIIPNDPDQYTYWHSTQATNFTKYNSPRVDKLLEDGRKTIDEDERTLIYQDFQRFLVEDSPAIFLHYLSSYTIERN